MKTKIKYIPYKPKFKGIHFTGENWSYISPTWEEMHQISLDLAVDILNKNGQFDVLVTLIKGGWTWSRTMADILNVPELASFKLTLYDPTRPGIKLEKPILGTPLTHSLHKKRVLLFDDVDDTGDSLKFALKYLDYFGPSSITTATLFHKPHSVLLPDFFGVETAAWIIFPHERREAIQGLTTDWLKQGIKINEIKKRLIKIGLPKKEIDLFTSLISRE